MTILTKLVVEHAFTLPLTSLTHRSLFQGATVAWDPKGKQLYFFQAQAKATGPGDVEDMYFHRFKIDLIKGVLVPVDTMIVKRAGHVQSFRTRISVEGNPWHMMGCETYGKDNKTTGTVGYRIMHQRRIATLDGTSKYVERFYSGSGNIQVIPSENPATVWVRRPNTLETYEEFLESTLRTWKPGPTKPKPIRMVTMVRGSTTYQSSCATPDGEIIRINGSTEHRSVMISSHRPIEIDITEYTPAIALPVTSEEGEAVFTWQGQAYGLKRFNSTTRRVVGACRVG